MRTCFPNFNYLKKIIKKYLIALNKNINRTKILDFIQEEIKIKKFNQIK